ncbi:MAG: iron-containing alcohol dehydrogenase [Candidatus Brocadiia bacterium]
MADLRAKARELIRDFKGDSYAFGPGAIEQSGDLAGRIGQDFLIVRGRSCEENGMLDGLKAAFDAAGLNIVGECLGAAPNSPVEDVERVRDEILAADPGAVVGLGGGSLIDAAKGSVTLASLGGTCEAYYGVDKVTQKLEASGQELLPMMAVQTASASAAHLTKYANITNMATMQKKLFIDEAVVPPVAVFDYLATLTMPEKFTKVGAFDGICHLLEVYFGVPDTHPRVDTVAEVGPTGLELIIGALPGAVEEPEDEGAREDIGLGTDLGGYAIMVGSTNGPHLNSFSLVDVMDHGQATALLLPYYTAFFAPAIQDRLLVVGDIYQRHGHIDDAVNLKRLPGTELGTVVGRAMARLAEDVGFPTKLDAVDGFGDEHVERMLTAAKDPSLASKLQGMPIPMKPGEVDRYMGSVLEAARTGDFTRIVPHDDYG